MPCSEGGDIYSSPEVPVEAAIGDSHSAGTYDLLDTLHDRASETYNKTQNAC